MGLIVCAVYFGQLPDILATEVSQLALRLGGGTFLGTELTGWEGGTQASELTVLTHCKKVPFVLFWSKSACSGAVLNSNPRTSQGSTFAAICWPPSALGVGPLLLLLAHCHTACVCC